MRKFLIPAIMLSAVFAAAPAAAQYGDGGGYRGDGRFDRHYGDDGYRGDGRFDRDGYRGDNRFDRQIDQLVRRIQRAEERDLISQREENRLLHQARQLNFLERRYSRGGFSHWEARDLQNRIQRLRAQFRWERTDNNDWRGGRRY